MLIWAAFGASVYGIIWFGQNVLFTAEEQVEQSHYLKDGVVPMSGYWKKIMLSNAFYFGMLALWIIYAAVFLMLILPMTSKLFFVAFYETSKLKKILDIAGAIFITSLALYLLWILHQVVVTARRITR
jgi:hypothetical protein